ncbi:hypothetical protein Agau_C100412 [Agrobacterium tumefaciens F2]|nr:hypothetical protein Agau_C100412 [Agrobacterium tumefaciens F2]
MQAQFSRGKCLYLLNSSARLADQRSRPTGAGFRFFNAN